MIFFFVSFRSLAMDLQALLRGKPFLSNEQVIQLVEEKFNIEVKRLKPLDGYDNQNFLVEGSPINDGNGRKQEMRRYSLKITNSKLSEEFECLKDATYMMQYLRGEGFSCPQPLSSKDANIFELVKCKNLALHGSGKWLFCWLSLYWLIYSRELKIDSKFGRRTEE